MGIRDSSEAVLVDQVPLDTQALSLGVHFRSNICLRDAPLLQHLPAGCGAPGMWGRVARTSLQDLPFDLVLAQIWPRLVSNKAQG